MRAQSPSNVHQYHNSPTRHRSKLSIDDGKVDDKNVEKQSKHETVVKKNAENNRTHPSSQAETNVLSAEIPKPKSSEGQSFDQRFRGGTSENKKNQSPDRKDPMSSKVDHSEKKMQGNTQNDDKNKGGLCTNNSI